MGQANSQVSLDYQYDGGKAPRAADSQLATSKESFGLADCNIDDLHGQFKKKLKNVRLARIESKHRQPVERFHNKAEENQARREEAIKVTQEDVANAAHILRELLAVAIDKQRARGMKPKQADLQLLDNLRLRRYYQINFQSHFELLRNPSIFQPK